MGKIMKSAPVYFTVAQVRYNPILSLATYIPNIQEHFRKHRFPDFKKGVFMTLSLSPQLQQQIGQEQPPMPTPTERYHFGNQENTKSFILEQGSLAFQATEYETFEAFSTELLEAMEVLNKAVGLSFVERVGLRYLDAVIPQAGETLKEYLVPEVMGLYGKLAGDVQHSFSETLTQIDDGAVMCRIVIQNGQIGFPPDLLQLMSLRVAERFTKTVGAHAIIDTDAFHQKRVVFSLPEAKKTLNMLHDRADKAFRATVTEHALAVWA